MLKKETKCGGIQQIKYGKQNNLHLHLFNLFSNSQKKNFFC